MYDEKRRDKTNLITEKAQADFDIIIESPKTAPIIWIKPPIKTPNAEIIPALLPWEILLEATYNISLPGVKLSMSEAIKNK